MPRLFSRALRRVRASAVRAGALLRPLMPQHPFPMDTTFRHCLLVNFSMPPHVLARALPRGLTPDLSPDGRAFLSVVIADLEAMRPAFVPRALGSDFTQVVYRAIVRAPNGERGVHFVRSDANSAWMSAAGNVFSNFHFNMADVCWNGRGALAEAASNVHAAGGPATAGQSLPMAPPPAGSTWLPTPLAEQHGQHGVDRFAHFALEPWRRGEHAVSNEQVPASIRASFDLSTASLTMPAKSSFAGQPVEQAQRFFVELYAAFNGWPERDFWSTVRIDRTQWRVVSLELAQAAQHAGDVDPCAQFDFMQRSPLFNGALDDIRLDSCFYVHALDYHWHTLERAEYRLDEASAQGAGVDRGTLEGGDSFTIPASLNEQVVMFHDGGCPLCTKEVAVYQRLVDKTPDSRLCFVDISNEKGAPKFSDSVLARHFGVSQTEALARIHVLDRGVLRTGAAAFVSIWRELPYWRHLATLCRLPLVVPTAELLYRWFAKARAAARGIDDATALGPGASCRADGGSATGSGRVDTRG